MKGCQKKGIPFIVCSGGEVKVRISQLRLPVFRGLERKGYEPRAKGFGR